MNLVLRNLQRDKIPKVLTILMTHAESYSRVNVIRVNGTWDVVSVAVWYFVSQGLMDLLDISNELKIFQWQTIIISFRLIHKSPIIIFILSIRKNLKGK